METEDKITPLDIPIQDIYKIHLLDSAGKVKEIIVFCHGKKDQKNLKELFTDLELAYFESEKVEIRFSKQVLHLDDSIRILKTKIMNELNSIQENSISYEELYMFYFASTAVDMENIYQSAVSQDASGISQDAFFQYVLNLNVNKHKLRNLDREKNSYPYEDWISLQNENKRFMLNKPLGFKFQEEYDYLFSANPYQTKGTQFTMSPKNRILAFENTVLLNYGEIDFQNLYVCKAEDVFEYAVQQGIDQEYMCQLYFPMLYNLGTTSTTALSETKDELIKDSKKRTSQAILKFYDSITMFYQIYWGRKSNLDYIKQGISKYSVKMNLGKSFPLEILFKNLSSTKSMPFIKYNPGPRRENMYRLYSEYISQNGKKIPYLSEPVILKLMKDHGKSNQIAIYIRSIFKDIQRDLYVCFDTHGKIHIYGEAPISPFSQTDFQQFVLESVNPIIMLINNILQSSGYSLKMIDSLSGDLIESANFKYTMILPIEKKIDLQKQSGAISNVFDIFTKDVYSSNGAVLRFKRVENFIEMDSQSALITEIYKQTNDSLEVIQTLIDQYRMTQEEAELRLAKYASEHQNVSGKIIENPGFSVSFKMEQFKNNLIVDVSDILGLSYIPILHMYVDTILRISQNPNSTIVSSSKIKTFCERVNKAAEEEYKPIIENIISTVEEETKNNLHDIQPFQFGDVEPAFDADDEDEGIYFDDDYAYAEDENDGEDQREKEEKMEEGEEEAQIGGENTPEAHTDEDIEKRLIGMSLKKPNPFLKAKVDLDPTLFLTKAQGKYKLYSRACPSSDRRQPIILTDAEKKRIDTTNPGSYENAIQYGSDPKNPYWYICPRYWCLKTNSSISEEDVKAGKCGGIIPQESDVVPKGAYVYEFANAQEHFDKNGKYINHHPGFLPKNKHPDGLCIPCCFGKQWNSEQLKKMRGQCLQNETDANAMDKAKFADKAAAYIISSTSFPLPQHRWGFLPIQMQLFLGTDSSKMVLKHNSALLQQDIPSLLRYGMEDSETKSFIACFAHFYAYKHKLAKTPSIKEMCDILKRSITLDMFLKYHNGNLYSSFRPTTYNESDIDLDKYLKDDANKSEFVKTLDLRDESQLEILQETIASYENFLDYINDENSSIDHTYFWDFIVEPNPVLMRDGFNLVIMEIPYDDITNNVQIICPTNSYSPNLYSTKKETIVLIKQSNYYEPIHQYQHMSNGEVIIKKAFLESKAIENVKQMLRLIQLSTKKYCSALPSRPKIYTFKQNIPGIESVRILKINKYIVKGQLVNYNQKTIGFLVIQSEDQKPVFVPCFPSGILEGIPILSMDDASIYLSYELTRDRLINIHQETDGKIPCLPKMKVMEDKLIVGILTETNQFIQIDPPVQNIYEDDLTEIKQYDYPIRNKSNVDKILATNPNPDQERVSTIKKISLETQFYSVFRNMIRIVLNDYKNYANRKQILDLLENHSIFYKDKLKQIERMLRDLTKDRVGFQIFDQATLDAFGEITNCFQDENGKCVSDPEKRYCLTTDDGICKTMFPKTNLLSNGDNEQIYFFRIADEIIRYRRIRLYLFHTKTVLNITNVEYKILPSELFLLESLLNHDYFQDLVPFNSNKHITNIHYDSAKPALTQRYSDAITMKDQDQLMNTRDSNTEMDEYILDCIEETKKNVIGNNKPGSWRLVFPPTAKEILFGNSIVCSYIPMIYVLQQHLKAPITIENIKTSLWNGYSQLTDLYYDKIIAILRKQGKRELMDLVKKSGKTLEHVILSDAYYITDLDWWIISRISQMPVFLFSSTTLKYLNLSFDWLVLYKGAMNAKYYFIRSPLDVGLNRPSTYHVIDKPFSFSELKGDTYLNAERGYSEFKEHFQTLDAYLSKYHLIRRVDR
jgi:hypothetical protein